MCACLLMRLCLSIYMSVLVPVCFVDVLVPVLVSLA